MNRNLSFYSNQLGALFGLDARITLGVFAVLSLVAGATLVVNLDSMHAKSLSNELVETGRAIEAIHNDTQADIYDILSEPSDKHAFEALYDNAVVKESNNFKGKWLGPYIKFTSNTHPRYGEMLIKKAGGDHVEACFPGSECYLWLVYTKVKLPIVQEVNNLLDGESEASPGSDGRLQWSVDHDNSVNLYFRASVTLGGGS